jgi:glycosyltransferase involved in cell wall biosynthesis
MRVVLLARSLETGGMQRQLVELALGLHSSDHAVDVVLFYGGNDYFEGQLRAAGVPLTVLGKSGRWDLLSFLLRLVRHVRSARADVVYSYLTVPNVLNALLRPLWRSARVVWGVRDSNVDFSAYTRALWLSFVVSRLLARRADLIVYNSQAGRRHYLAAGYPAATSIVVPNGIDASRFSRDDGLRQAVRASWSVGERPLIGVVARLDPMKGHETFLDAAALLSRRRPDVRFVCVGTGPPELRAHLERRARAAGLCDVLTWSGEERDVVRAYSALDVLCLPSWSAEGFPNVVGEGLACGLPAVVTTVGDAADVVAGAGVSVPPRDAAALAAALERVLDDWASDPAGVALRSRSRVLESYSPQLLVERTVAAFRLAGRSKCERHTHESKTRFP